MPLLATLASALLLPGFAPFAAGPAGGEVWTGTFPGTARPGYVYLPPGFDGARRYTVVYLLHGMPGSPSEYLSGTQLPAFADEAIEHGIVRPFIAVIPAAGTDRGYNGEWAGPWERGLVGQTVPFVDRWLPTIASPRGRVIAGLSAGGYGAVDIGIHHPSVFGSIESWSGYFKPLHDGPFKEADTAELAANDPTQLAVADQARLARAGTRFFVSSGPSHSHWFRAGDTVRFARELRGLGLPVELRLYSDRKGEWRKQLDAGLAWALPAKA
jgi:enterochelin esterase-like enzyme